MEELVSYAEELEIENKELKKHIFNIQQQLNEQKETIGILEKKIEAK